MGKLVILEKSFDSHLCYKPPWFRIPHSSVVLWLHFSVLDVVKIVWFRYEHDLETVGDSVCEGTPDDFVVYYPAFFTGRGNF